MILDRRKIVRFFFKDFVKKTFNHIQKKNEFNKIEL